jgi:hypothetical protein
MASPSKCVIFQVRVKDVRDDSINDQLQIVNSYLTASSQSTNISKNYTIHIKPLHSAELN